MNILIVGNGFDLSHYLPTKYDHFMLVMRAIEKKDLEKPINDVLYSPFEHPLHLITKYFQISKALDKKTYQMDFDELFSQFKHSKDLEFIGNTKKNYDVSDIHLIKIKVQEIQNKLNKNGWYQYFKNHVEEIKTWIDFEQKIEEILIFLGETFINCEELINKDNLDGKFYTGSDLYLKIINKHRNAFKYFNFFENEEYEIYHEPHGRQLIGQYTKANRETINSKFCIGNDPKNGFDQSSFVDSIYRQLEEFIEIFNLYLELIIDKLKPKATFRIFVQSNSLFQLDRNEWAQPDLIYSFNYTNTYQRIHSSVKVEYLHGSHGQQQNIVLGVSDLEDGSLKKLKAYGFTKYHQKLFKDTDYLFLDHFKEKVQIHKKKIEYFEKDFGDSDPTTKKFTRQNLMEVESKLNLNISIWGHSLDLSDKDYIIDLFSLNDDMDRNVRVTVYYFDQNAKFALLNNLLAILEKDKVEQWMKNKWLVFKPNPEIKFNEMISEKTA